MTLTEQDKFIDGFIKKNNLKNNPKNKNIIKMVLRGSKAKELKTDFELSQYLKEKFI